MNSQGTPIALPLRIWLAVEVLFGIGAVLAIGVSPAETKTNFAWPIQPVVMAAVLGAFYASSAFLFVLPLFFAKRWEMIRIMILPTVVFATAQLIATFLHWDKFSIGTTPFYVWFASYLLPPPIFISAYVWHQRRVKSQDTQSDSPLPAWMRSLFLIGGSLLVIGAIFVFIFPDILIPSSPWKLTALTARSLCAWVIVIGAILISMVRENDKIRVRIGTPFLILLLPTLLIQLTRFSNEINWANPILWFGFILAAIIGICGSYLAIGSWKESLN